MSETLTPKQKKPCTNCPPASRTRQAGPPVVIPRRAYTPTRPSCVECVEKHLGAAYVLLTETRDLPAGQAGGYAYHLRAIGHLFEAEDESQEWPELHNAIRGARKAYQADGTMPDFAVLGQQVAAVTSRIAGSK